MAMKTYAAEQDIVERVLKNTSIAYCSPVERDKNRNIEYDKLAQELDITSASIKDKDLYFHKSILVSTIWNKNDDVFVPAEVWAARHTPEDKPNNLNHDDSIIVGHMTSNMAIDENGNIIADDTSVDDLPNKFHILTSEVIYKVFENQECQERANNLIAAIENGEMFVSMECRFDDFDYALKYADGNIKYLIRDNDTAYLTQYLKAYGGSGVYSDISIGRVIKNLYFSGKGYVAKPANPDSVIFTHCGLSPILKGEYIHKDDVLENFGVLYCSEKVSQKYDKQSTKESLMSDNALETRNKELQDTVSVLQAKIDELNEKLVKSDLSKYESEISTLKSQLSESTDEIEQLKSQISDVTAELKKSSDDYETVAKEKQELTEALAKVEAEKLRASRISVLVDGGIDKKLATEKVDLFEYLNDKQFDAVAQEIIKANITPETEVDETVDPDETDESGEQVSASVDLESVETPSDPDLSIESENDDSNLRKELKTLASSLMSRKQKESK